MKTIEERLSNLEQGQTEILRKQTEILQKLDRILERSGRGDELSPMQQISIREEAMQIHLHGWEDRRRRPRKKK